MKGRERPANRKHTRLSDGAPYPAALCKSPCVQWPAAGYAAGRMRSDQAACAAARDGPRLIRSTISAPTMHSPPEIIDAIV